MEAVFDAILVPFVEHIYVCSTNYGKKNGIESFSDIEETYQYICILLVMGIVQLPSKQDHFRTNSGYYNSYVSQLMTQERFETLSKSFSGSPDNLLTTEKLLNNLISIWQAIEHLSIDEIMTRFKGRCKYRQCIRGKPNSTGLKIFGGADKFGYLLYFWLYRGSDTLPLVEEELDHHNVGTKCVLKVVNETIENRSGDIIICADSYFGSLDLARAMNKHFDGIPYVFTLNKNRGGNAFKDVELDKTGDIFYTYNEEEKFSGLAVYDSKKCFFLQIIALQYLMFLGVDL
eukprot:TRINITY_DN214_c1_g1_i5.p1 TRINITY_DN214_c1_g1~~TRINITY_DN214_c1_g1_i5.p1  ORF type:complete len:288 (+),score=59.31 TRINITY_DN214_c1_g1_i5:33-896(+)